MAVTTTKTNKPINPRGNDQSPKGYNRAALYSGKALDFDGVNDNVDLDGFTMAGDVATIVFQAKFISDGYLMDINTQRFVIRNRAADGVGVYNSNGWVTYGFTNRDELGFYAVVSDGTTQRVYYNGHQLGFDKTVTALDWDSITNMALGSSNDGTFSFLDGQIAGFKIFNTALTAAQVADLYNNPEKVVPTGVDNTALKLWLPMQEGAGTTAYDGSGNGNHGTISGATWTHGIGAPVSQTAVIDWNKSTNKVTNSYDISGILNTTTGVTFNYAEAPDGTQTATRFVAGFDFNIGNVGVDGDTRSLWIRATSGSGDVMVGARYTATYDLITLTEEWQRVERPVVIGQSGEPLFYLVDFRHGGTTLTDVLVWCPQVNVGATADPTLLTTGTAQTSPVLLPQGLTSGRDITGVNLFENVRKQGALNLDGNSWAEVHDNASLDVTTGLTLEAWIYIEDNATQGRILNKWGASGADRSYQVFMNNAVVRFLIGDGTSQNGLNSATSLSVGNWYHIVGTYDSTNIKIYIDGSEDVSVAETFTLVDSAETLYLGTYYNQTNTSVNPLAQPRIYNRALTAEEVERNYNAGKNIYK